MTLFTALFQQIKYFNKHNMTATQQTQQIMVQQLLHPCELSGDRPDHLAAVDAHVSFGSHDA
jgi:hypothetical protein